VGSNIEVAKPLIFNGEARGMEGFIMVCRLYLKMRMRGAGAEKQIQWELLYMQRGSADMWKKNLLEDLEAREVEFGLVGKFLMKLTKEFGREDEKSVKVDELKKSKTRSKDHGGICAGVQKSS